MKIIMWIFAIISFLLGLFYYHRTKYAADKRRMLELLFMAAWYALYAAWFIVVSIGDMEAMEFAIMVASCCPMIARGVITKSSMVRMNSIICILFALLNALNSYAALRS